jgi:hypothetical protein
MNRKWLIRGLVALVAGGIATAVGWAVNPSQAAYSYLFAFSTAFALVTGMMFVLLIGNASNAKWFVPLRRVAEDIVMVLPVLAALFIPVLLSLRHLYKWTGDLSDLSVEARKLVEKKLAYLNAPFFVGRAIVYFVLLIGVAWLLRRWSVRQEREAPERLRQRIMGFSAAALVVVSFVVTFASWDWIMSLRPDWYSNMFGVYYFAGGTVAGYSLLSLVIAGSRRHDDLPLTPRHSFAVGRMMLAFVIFWTYIGFANSMLVWIADNPEEVTWYVDRVHGGWQWYGILMVIAHFCIPFAVLLSQGLKLRPRSGAGEGPRLRGRGGLRGGERCTYPARSGRTGSRSRS